MKNIKILKEQKATAFITKYDKPLGTLEQLFYIFIICAFIGWTLETVYCSYLFGEYIERGFLFGPLCPIYGFGVILLLLVLKPYAKNNILLFLISAVVFTAFEYIVGFMLDAIFGLKFWDYSNDMYQINSRITLWMCFAWGLLGLIFMHYIYPTIQKIFDKTIYKLKYPIQHIVVLTLFIAFILDTILSTIKYLS